MKIYTKTGDTGSTSLFGGMRVFKNHLRIESYGTIDELNSYIGLVRDQKINQNFKKILAKIQNDLFTIGAMLATPPQKDPLKNRSKSLNIIEIGLSCIQFLEDQIDLMNQSLPKMTHFILPGGHQIVSFCHISRCVCRRAERLVVALNENEPIDNNILKYLNRLSDYLFVLARKLTRELSLEEIKWVPKKKK